MPDDTGEEISLNCFRPLPTKSSGNAYIVLVTDRLSQLAGLYPLFASERSAFGTDSTLVSDHIPISSCPKLLVTGNAVSFEIGWVLGSCLLLVTTR